jgi:hypothetical protein
MSASTSITVFIANQVVVLKRRFAAGEAIDAVGATVLNNIKHRRVKARLRYLLDRKEIAPDEVQAKANELMAQDIVDHMTSDDGDILDSIFEEALSIAREMIVTRMAQEGHLPPKGLDNHAKALVNAMPEIQERARKRMEARFLAAAKAIDDISQL